MRRNKLPDGMKAWRLGKAMLLSKRKKGKKSETVSLYLEGLSRPWLKKRPTIEAEGSAQRVVKKGEGSETTTPTMG